MIVKIKKKKYDRVFHNCTYIKGFALKTGKQEEHNRAMTS